MKHALGIVFAAFAAISAIPAVQAEGIEPHVELVYGAAKLEGWAEGTADLQLIEYAPKGGENLPIYYDLAAAQVDMANPVDFAAVTDYGFAASQPSHVETATYQDPLIKGTSTTHDAYLAITPTKGMPSPKITFTDTCVDLAPAEPAPWAPRYYAARRETGVPAMEANTTEPIALGGCNQDFTRLVVTGSFTLTNWGWNDVVQTFDSQGQPSATAHNSGYDWDANIGNQVGTGTMTQNFLTVTLGQLSIVTRAHVWPHIIVGSLEATAEDATLAGDLLRANVVGSDVQVSGDEFVAEGRNQMMVSWESASSIQVGVQGPAVPRPAPQLAPVEAIVPNEPQVEPETVAVEGSGGNSAWLVHLGVSALLAALALYWFAVPSRRSAEWHNARANHLAREGNFLMALRHSSAALLRGSRDKLSPGDSFVQHLGAAKGR